MKILLIGGFLGSGKTTLIRVLTEQLRQRSERPIAIIENEAGREGLDARLLAQTQIHVTEIYGGCLCCQYAGNLLPAVESLETKYDPEWLIIELTGLALLSGVLEMFQSAGRAGQVTSVCVADATRWDRIRLATGDMLLEQAKGARVVILNKLDIVPATAPMEEELAKKLPQAVVLKAALREGLPSGVLDILF